MTIKRMFFSLRRYGLRLCWNGFLRQFKKSPPDSLTATLQAAVDLSIAPSRGITLLGDFSGTHSLNKMLRDFAVSLRQAKVPYQIFDTARPVPQNFVLNRYTDIIGMFFVGDHHVSGISACRQHRIMFWEFETGMTDYFPKFLDGDPVLVFSDFCHRSIGRQVGKNIKVNLMRFPFHGCEQIV